MFFAILGFMFIGFIFGAAYFKSHPIMGGIIGAIAGLVVGIIFLGFTSSFTGSNSYSSSKDKENRITKGRRKPPPFLNRPPWTPR